MPSVRVRHRRGDHPGRAHDRAPALVLTPTPGRAPARRRPLRLLGAPTNLGLAPYADGTPRRVVDAPAALRALDLVRALGAEDLGDVPAAPYRDVARGALAIRNAEPIEEHARRLADAVARAVAGARDD